MKYRVQVDVAISQADSGFPSNYPLRMQETLETELSSLADAATILVKLHDFFESIKSREK